MNCTQLPDAVKKVTLDSDFMHITHVECHRTHKSYRSHALHYDHWDDSAEFQDIFNFFAGQKIFTPHMVNDLDLFVILRKTSGHVHHL